MAPLIDVMGLVDRLGDPDLVICDVRWYLADPARGRREYDAGHVAGAAFVDLHGDLAGGPGGGRHPLPDVARFAELLGRLGIGPSTSVVAYDDSGGAIAARLWWMLGSIGHRRRAVLDGGFSAWLAAGQPISAGVPVPTPVVYPSPARWRAVVDADEVGAAVGGGSVVIDARATERYRGEHEPIDPRAGHIPGAINLPHADNLASDGSHRSTDELAERFADVGDDPIVYCGSGVTACHELLAMALAGVPGGRLYPGSWSDWCSDPDRPIATI
jgi:thiosulfate/3-mercaptopyruvate sulfurtransferase